MAGDLRMGLEMEFHRIILTLVKRGTKKLWPGPPPNIFLGESEILVPKDDVHFKLNGKTNWESDWGFRAVGDCFTNDSTVFGEKTYTCILELATAANTYGDHAYWTSSRLCAKEFAKAMDHFKYFEGSHPIPDADVMNPQIKYQWYTLSEFVMHYNQNVNLMPPRTGFDKTQFHLKLSTDVESLASGTFPGHIGENWDAIVSTNHQLINPNSPPICDIQINYQVELEWLDQNTDSWIGLWNSMWANNVLDPKVGLHQSTPMMEIYRTQVFAALWRAAKEKANDLAEATPPAALHAVRGLLTYLIVAGSVSVVEGGATTSKNFFPQLPKTSPASITNLIAQLHPEAAKVLKRFASPATLAIVKTDISRLSVLSNLVASPGELSNLSPRKGEAPYTESVDGKSMLSGNLNPNFDIMWPTSLEVPGPALTKENRFGFTNDAPFYCPWAVDVNTSYPAARHGRTGIKMLFEGRYATDKLNIGFNPYAKDFMFNRSYLSIVRALAPEASVAPAEAAINKMFPDDRAIQQNFPQGYGPH